MQSSIKGIGCIHKIRQTDHGILRNSHVYVCLEIIAVFRYSVGLCVLYSVSIEGLVLQQLVLFVGNG